MIATKAEARLQVHTSSKEWYRRQAVLLLLLRLNLAAMLSKHCRGLWTTAGLLEVVPSEWWS